MNLDVRVVSAESFGAACLEAVLETVAGIDQPVVGLPTGNTPRAFYAALGAAVASGNADISRWRPFAIDEYGGPGDHPCANRAFFAQLWEAIPGAPEVQQFDPAADSAAEVARYERALAGAGGLTVAVLGIGLNGHVAFNEPGSETTSRTRRVTLHEASRDSAAACWGTATPTWGLTMGLAELLAARRVVVLANGGAKAGVVARALQGPQSSDCPASYFRAPGRATWVLDRAAAGKLPAR